MASTRAMLAGGVAAVVAGSVALWAWQRNVQAELSRSFDRHAAAYAGSDTCKTCHRDRHASWHRTFHRTMTQEAGPDSVLGRFDGTIVDYWGVPVRPSRVDGRYYFEYLDRTSGEAVARVEVKRTVGSHRYQQYLGQDPRTGNNYHRLQLLWHVGDQRWVHMNGAFLYDDEQGFQDHTTTWDHNCIFCHNTGPQPRIQNADELYGRIAAGEPVNFTRAARYDSQVAELGIACEACHGPGAEHAARNRDPMRRYTLELRDLPDPTITNPRRLDARRASEVCGQCHGQRVPAALDLMERWLHDGPTYRPGDRLADHVRLVTRKERGPEANPDLFRQRFWRDGTPRLSAYEMQGLVQSKCYEGGKLSCMNCHDAHGGDVNGMMRDEARGNAPCLACHEAIAADVPAHTRHEEASSGSLCYNCHMPKAVYGVMEIHRSHRIEVPAPARNAAQGRPGACTGCHMDKSAAWAQQQVNDWGGREANVATEGSSEHLRQLLGGDPVQRAVAARLAGRTDSALGLDQRAALVPALLIAMRDPYPAVRRFAAHSLRAVHEAMRAAGQDLGMSAALEDFDFIGPLAQRQDIARRLQAAWEQHPLAAQSRLDPVLVAKLQEQAAASNKSINMGE